MLKRTLVIAGMLVVFVSAVSINLAILDILSVEVLRESLGKIVAVIVVSAVAMVLIIGLSNVARTTSDTEDGSTGEQN